MKPFGSDKALASVYVHQGHHLEAGWEEPPIPCFADHMFMTLDYTSGFVFLASALLLHTDWFLQTNKWAYVRSMPANSTNPFA